MLWNSEMRTSGSGSHESQGEGHEWTESKESSEIRDFVGLKQQASLSQREEQTRNKL